MGAGFGLQAVHALRGGRVLEHSTYQMLVLSLTFMAYCAFHLSRKPPSIAKSVLSNPQQGWHPFDGTNGQALLGETDLAFLASYAAGMFVAGHLGDRLDLRLFLTAGMVGSGVFVGLFGMGFFWDVHSLGFFVIVQIGAGLFQSTGWPSVVSVVANWFGKGKRGLIMGVWNAHTSLGNILGAVIASSCLSWGWGYSFVVPGIIMVAAGLLIFALLPASPEDVGLPSLYSLVEHHPVVGQGGGDTGGLPLYDSAARFFPSAVPTRREAAAAVVGEGVEEEVADETAGEGEEGEEDQMLEGGGEGEEDQILVGGLGSEGGGGGPAIPGATEAQGAALPFSQAWFIPGVASFAFALFFAKLVAYTFLYWLPFYVSRTDVGGKRLTPEQAGDLSTVFDVGGVLGGVLAGVLSDHTGSPALVASSFVYGSVPVLYLFSRFGHVDLGLDIFLMTLSGVVVNGPYALITTSVSADLGTHESLKGNARALATVTAIIDGTGSIGAALGPLLTGYISAWGWDKVFYMLYAALACAGLLLTPLARRELQDLWARGAGRTGGMEGVGGVGGVGGVEGSGDSGGVSGG